MESQRPGSFLFLVVCTAHHLPDSSSSWTRRPGPHLISPTSCFYRCLIMIGGSTVSGTGSISVTPCTGPDGEGTSGCTRVRWGACCELSVTPSLPFSVRIRSLPQVSGPTRTSVWETSKKVSQRRGGAVSTSVITGRGHSPTGPVGDLKVIRTNRTSPTRS